MKSLLAALLLCFCATGLFAQANATLGGTASDSSGALLPGVTVTARNVNTGASLTSITNEAGSYSFASLQPGAYRVTATLPGFSTKTYDKVELSQSQQVRLNFTLEVATVAQAVEVTIDADTELATTTASVGTVIRVDQVNLPLQTRNILDLAASTPGALSTGANNANTTFAGTRSSQVNTTRDGLVVSDGRYMDWNGAFAATYTTPDLVEEIQITTNTIDAEVGRGSGQVRLQTRSGGNQFHGALFYTNNNSALNAMNFFDNLARASKPYANRNQFGGRIGGPIKENKAFFFFLYEGQRYLRKEEFIANVLTPTARQGIFRYLTETAAAAAPNSVARRNGNAFASTPSVDLAGNVLSTHNGVPLFLNQIDLFNDVHDPNRTRIDPVWVAPQLLKLMPLPNDYRVGDGLNTAGFRWLRPIRGSEDATGVTNNSNRDQYNVRVDYQLTSQHKLFGTMSREKDTGLTAQAGIAAYPNGFNGVVERRPQIYTAALTSIFGPSVVNEFRWGLRKTSFYGWTPIHLGCCSGDSDTDINELAEQAAATYPTINGYLLNITSGLTFPRLQNEIGNTTLGSPIAPHGTGGTRGSDSPLWSFADTFSWTHGKHSFKVGAELIFANSNGWNTGNTDLFPRATLGEGAVPVQGISAGLNGTYPKLNTNDVNPAKDLLSSLAGTVSEITQGFIINNPTATTFDDYKVTIRRQRDIHENDWSLFFKDSWRLTTNFTLNLGLRYDKYGVPWEASGLAGRATGGQSGLFGISGKDFSALWRPGATGGALTTFELIGKNSPNSNLQAYKDDWNNFGPSVGFSWNLPFFDRPTILRGGYGITYTGGATFLTYDTTTLASIPGTDNLRTVNPSTYTDLTTVSLPLTPTGPPLAPIPVTALNVDFAAYDDRRVIPYVQNFTFSVQRELAKNLSVEVSYSGTKGTKLWSPIQLNEVNIFENGILDAFNTVRAGGESALFNQMLLGFTVPSQVGLVNGTTLTGSEALRRFPTTNIWIANGEVGALANFFNTTTAIGGSKLAMLRNAGLADNTIVVNPQFRSLGLHGNNDNSTYHSLVTQVRKRTSNGLTAEFAHTWARAIGNTAIPAGVGTDTTLTTRDPRNRDLQKGLETFHRRHSFNIFGGYDLPFGANRRFLAGAPRGLDRIVGGWQISGIFNWSTGQPLGFNAGNGTNSATVFRQTLGAQNSVNTADLVGNLGDFGKAQVRSGFVEYFENLKTAAAPAPNFNNATVAGRFTNQVVRDQNNNIVLQNPQPGTTGNTSQRWFEGPAQWRADAALTKKVLISEGKTFTIRADAVNVLNKPVWGNPNTDINSNLFGRITTATGSRTITISGRVDF
jgi:hypothetical protein